MLRTSSYIKTKAGNCLQRVSRFATELRAGFERIGMMNTLGWQERIKLFSSVRSWYQTILTSITADGWQQCCVLGEVSEALASPPPLLGAPLEVLRA